MIKIHYKKIKSDKYKYILLENYIVQTKYRPIARIVTDYLELGTDGVMLIRKSYCWDGPSGLTIDTENFMRGSLVHDGLYQLIRERHLSTNQRDMADRLLRRICRDDGMSWFRAWYVFKAVSWFGAKFAKPK